MELVRDLCSFEGRQAGTDSERQAANFLAKRLKESGNRRVDVEPTYVRPQWALTHALHCLLGVAGSLVAIEVPAVGFGLVLFAALSMYLDANARFQIVRRLFFRRASQNVYAQPRRGGKPGRVVICAHYDIARTGAAFRARNIARMNRLNSALPFSIEGFRPLFWSLFLLLPILGARMAGVEDNWLGIIQLAPTLVLVVGVFALTDIALSEPVPGANDNASGTATAISVAAELEQDPPQHLDVSVVLTGAEECLMSGMSSFLRTHRRELDPKTTWFINLNSVGKGELRYVTSEGAIVGYQLDPGLSEMAMALAAGGGDVAAEPLRYGFATDALPVRLAGGRVITLTCLEPGLTLPSHYHNPNDVPDHLDPDALDRAHAFAVALIRLLDRDLGRSAEVHEKALAGVDST